MMKFKIEKPNNSWLMGESTLCSYLSVHNTKIYLFIVPSIVLKGLNGPPAHRLPHPQTW